MKSYKITHKNKTYIVKAKDSIDAVKKIEEVQDERLSPMTYRKLKEFGYTHNQWKNLSQEQANKIVASHEQKKLASTEQKKSVEKKSTNSLQNLSPKEKAKILESTKENGFPTSKTVLTALKMNGIDKGVTVRHKWFSGGDSFDLTIRSPYIDKRKVETIAKQYQDYDVDERTGEILLGGNTYVFADYADDVFDEVSKPYLPQAEESFKKFRGKKEGLIEPINDDINVSSTGISDTQGNPVLEILDKRTYSRRRVYDPQDMAKYLFQIKQFGSFVD